MSLITYFLRPVRVIMGDRDPTVQQYSDSAIADAVKTVIQMGKLPCFKLSVDENSITPDITDPNQFALICYHVGKLFVAPTPDGYSYRTRAISERFGNARTFLGTIESELHKLENGTMFAGVQSYYSWLAGMEGLPLWQVMTDMQVRAPFETAVISRGGIAFGS